jgi:pimeloyl-ACP methyl ester carboxylesterase/class 3 adenylate cyclase/acyl dehydratase
VADPARSNGPTATTPAGPVRSTQMQHDLAYFNRPDGVTLAYAAAGAGPPLVFAVGWLTHLEWLFRQPTTLLVEPLAEHLRLITFDKHGSGLSDRDRTEFTLESEVYDIEALVDHLGLKRFYLMGMSEGGLAAAAYAARHPDRVEKLVLYSTTANGTGLGPPEFTEAFVNIIRSAWGMGSNVIADMIMPGASKEDQHEFAIWQRQSASAEVAAGLMDMLYHTDIRPILPQIEAPTLIIHRRNSRPFPPRNGRELAAGIPKSKVVIIDGVTHFPPTPGDPNTIDVVNEILGFLVPGASAQAVRHRDTFRTVMFTDVEGSTKLTDRLGDEQAREVLRRHEDASRRVVVQHGGTEIKTMGDGFMVSFASASAALEAAAAIQQAIAEEFTEDGLVRVRIGINAGEPIAEDGDLHGTAVIRASRIMDIADGGQVLVSALVRELVAGRDYRFISRGLKTLKGFEDPVGVFELDWRHEGPASPAAGAAAVLQERIGVDAGPGEWFTITLDPVAGFTTAVGGETGGEVPPYLLVSLLTHLASSVPDSGPPPSGLQMGINSGFERVRFADPVAVGSRVRARAVVDEVTQAGPTIRIVWSVRVEVEGRDAPALDAQWVIRAVYTG